MLLGHLILTAVGEDGTVAIDKDFTDSLWDKNALTEIYVLKEAIGLEKQKLLALRNGKWKLTKKGVRVYLKCPGNSRKLLNKIYK